MITDIPFEGPYYTHVPPPDDKNADIISIKPAINHCNEPCLALMYKKAQIGEAKTMEGALMQRRQYDPEELEECYNSYFVEEGLPNYIKRFIKLKHMYKRGEISEQAYKKLIGKS